MQTLCAGQIQTQCDQSWSAKRNTSNKIPEKTQPIDTSIGKFISADTSNAWCCKTKHSAVLQVEALWHLLLNYTSKVADSFTTRFNTFRQPSTSRASPKFTIRTFCAHALSKILVERKCHNESPSLPASLASAACEIAIQKPAIACFSGEKNIIQRVFHNTATTPHYTAVSVSRKPFRLLFASCRSLFCSVRSVRSACLPSID